MSLALAASLFLAGSGSYEDVKVVAVNVAKRVAVFDVLTLGDEEDSSRCDLDATGGKARSLVVVSTKGIGETISLADFHDAPCPTKESVAKALAAAKKTLRDEGLDLDKPGHVEELSPTGPNRAVAVASSFDDPEDAMASSETSTVTVYIDNVAVFKNAASWSRNYAGQGSVDYWLAGDGAQRFLIEGIYLGNMRGGDEHLRVVDDFAAPKALSIDVAALKAIALSAACSVSIASNAALQSTVAVTIADALGRGHAAPVTTSKKERQASVVYANKACVATAKSIAAKLPGGATVEPLTWKSTGGIVVALGAPAPAAKR